MAKDHYVPQFYLRNFEIKNPPHPIQPRSIYSYIRELNPKPCAIKSVASEIDFDTINAVESDEKESLESYNKLLKASEDIAPQIIDRIVNSSTFSLSTRDIEALSWFAALLCIRTPTAHRYFEKDILSFYENILKPRIQRDCINNKEEIYRILRAEQPDITDREIEDVIELFKNTDSWMLSKNDNNKAYLRLTGNAYLSSLVNDLSSKNWHLLVTQGDDYFVTSDNPIVFCEPRIIRIQQQLLFDCPIFLPLSPKKALYVHHYKFCENMLIVDKSHVEHFVGKVMERAENRIFSDRSCSELQGRFDTTTFVISNLNFRYVFIPYHHMKALTMSGFKHAANN